MTGLGPKFCSIVEDMYINASYRIKLGNKLGFSFTTNVGLCQGDPLSPLLFNFFTADIIFAFTAGCSPPMVQDLPVPSVQFADDICNFSTTPGGLRESLKCTLDYCQANRLRVNLNKSCYTVYNAPKTVSCSDIAINGQLLRFDPKPCYLEVCLSDNKSEQNSIMLQKAFRAAYGLRSMIDNTAVAAVINKLFEQLIEPILLYAVEQWLPYIHPRKVDKFDPIDTFSSLSCQLNTEEGWKRFIYSHYTLNETTPVLAVRAEIGSYPTFIAGISRLAKYMLYITDEGALVRKAVLTQKVMASKNKFTWWNNSWRILEKFNIQNLIIRTSPLKV